MSPSVVSLIVALNIASLGVLVVTVVVALVPARDTRAEAEARSAPAVQALQPRREWRS